jgi:predicted house-cleaning NTP pyrophosphatase (Maf/HAM1 superfamily)
MHNCGINLNNGNEIISYGENTFAAVTHVKLQGVNREIIAKMIADENPYRCSGGFTLDGVLKPYFSIVRGTEENVIGLPLAEILEILNDKR